MKTLILVRHAQTIRDHSALSDFDRPLSRSGQRDAFVLAERFADIGLRVDALISSPAVRALSTAEAFAQKLSRPVQTDQRVYNAGVPELLETVQSFENGRSTVVLVGHNPGLSEFLRYLTEENYADLPVAAMAVVDIPVKVWRHVFAGKGVLKNGLCPNAESPGARRNDTVPGRADRFRIWRFEHAKQINQTIIFVFMLLLILGIVGLIMQQSKDSSAMPQQGSSFR